MFMILQDLNRILKYLKSEMGFPHSRVQAGSALATLGVSRGFMTRKTINKRRLRAIPPLCAHLHWQAVEER